MSDAPKLTPMMQQYFEVKRGLPKDTLLLFRLGDLSRFISHSVIVGFTLGAAVLLALDQSRNLLGLPRAGEHDDHFLVRFFLTMRQVDQISYRAVAIGSLVIAGCLKVCQRAIEIFGAKS